MILGVNGIRLVRKRSGVARATEAILNAFAGIDQPFDDIRVYTPEPLDSAVTLPSIARNIVVPSRLSPALWEQLALPRAHGSRDVLLCPSYIVPVLARSPTLLIHHGSYEGYSRVAEVFPWTARMKSRISYPASAWRATALSTVSEHSRRDIARFYRIPVDRIHVIPDGVDTTVFKPLPDPDRLSAWRRRVFGADVPFVVYVGKPTRRRNLPNLLRAFRVLKSTQAIPHKLLLIGTALPGTPFESIVDELALAGDVVTIPYAPHEEIAVAYNASTLNIYPSDYEGFGMPVLEAMACGTPTIALDNTAFPEFAGGVAMLLPDARVETLVRGMTELIADDQARARMAVEGPRRAAAYEWRIIARRYADLLRSLVR
ncbi:MAG TPA: glycosyltransferase family 1 protein [Vicinamibacterales bacterium]|nr:glycosyltransferase family 1 protein [Vicinamibacterales bacterium]